MTDIDALFKRRLESDPAIQELLYELGMAGRDPRYRYWETDDGWQFHYTTERMGDGKFASAIYMPTGRGARSGKGKVTRLEVRREVHTNSRRAAKARAYKLYTQHRDELKERAK